ncbi:MAG: amidohydrolase [Kiritimatiellae bacterium]|nr:amidohydrolase [Kiritimatiellia bacterium]
MQNVTLFLKDCRAFLPNEGFVRGVGIAVRGAKIVRARKDLRPAKGVPVFDACGAPVTPGLVDGHTHLGLSEVGDGDVNETSDPVCPYLRAADAINPLSADFCYALMNGITTAMVAPGSTNIFGGLALVMKTRGRRLQDMVLRDPVGMKMALGQNPKRAYGSKGKLPSTRMGNAYLMRKTFQRALDYRAKRRKRTGRQDARDAGLENVLAMLDGKLPARLHCHRADDIMTGLRIADEFGFPLCIDHASESYLVAAELAERDIPCFVGPNYGVPTKNETLYKGFSTARKLREAGVRIAIMTDHGVEPCWYLPISAALAVRSGLAADDGLRAITAWPAEIMGIDRRVGALARGRDADIVVWDKSPLEMGKPVAVFVDGTRVTPEEIERPFKLRDL